MRNQADRTRRRTAAEVRRCIDNMTVASLSGCAKSPAAVERRLSELDREWDTTVPWK